jgi:CDGSH-type Zn-finger protein
MRQSKSFACSTCQKRPQDVRLVAMRKVLKSDKGPFEIKPQQESVWICMCGLSKNQPFCDGSHKTTRDEEDGKTYEYDVKGHRREV